MERCFEYGIDCRYEGLDHVVQKVAEADRRQNPEYSVLPNASLSLCANPTHLFA
jgi:hypothetical protein